MEQSGVYRSYRLDDESFPSAPAPVLAQIGLTYRCLYDCSHCYARSRRALHRELSFREAGSLVTALVDLGTIAIVYSHGESLLRRDFHAIASFCRDRQLHQTLMTTGRTLAGLEQAQRIKDCGIGSALVSVDSVDAAKHDAGRGAPGAFDAAVRGAMLLKRAQIRSVGFSVTLRAENCGELPGLLEFAASLGLDAVSLMPLRSVRQGGSIGWDRSRRAEVCGVIEEYSGRIEVYSHDPLPIDAARITPEAHPRSWDLVEANRCHAGRDVLSIDPAGDVRACNFLPEVFGNVRERAIGAIWDAVVARFRAIRSRLPAGCAGGCMFFRMGTARDWRCDAGETAPRERSWTVPQ